MDAAQTPAGYAGSSAPVIIKIIDVVKTYGSGDAKHTALKGVSFDIFKGEFVIIFGPSGSGKSTLLNLISGLDRTTEGEILIENINLSKLNDQDKARFHREKIGMVFQAYNLIPTLTVRQNIALPLIFAEYSHEDRKIRADELLESFNLSDVKHRLPTEISGGQQQRVGIMRALANKPPILIADEPTGNLDSQTSQEVMTMFSSLHRDLGVTVVVVTHDPNHFKWADRVVHVLDGKVVKQTIYHSRDFYDDITNLEDKRPKEEKKPEQIETSAFHLLWNRRATLEPETEKLLRIIEIVFSNEQLEKLSESEILNIVQAMKYRIAGSLASHEFLMYLDNPPERGGLGLYSQTAARLSEEIDSMIALFGHHPLKDYKIAEAPHDLQPVQTLSNQIHDEVGESLLFVLSDWLTHYQRKHLKPEQIDNLIQAVRLRVRGAFTSSEFKDLIDKSPAEGGVGLYHQTSVKISEKVEHLMRILSLASDT